ncbi:MAG: hypothetical protein WDO73_00065 [Ignavibacteriota bacterium]
MYRFRLNSATIAVRYGADGKQSAVIKPGGAEVVTDDPDVLDHNARGSKLVSVNWAGSTVDIFLVDLQERGERAEHAGG